MDIRRILDNAKTMGVVQVSATQEFIPHVYEAFAKHLGIKDRWDKRQDSKLTNPKTINRELGRKGYALVENEQHNRMSLIYKGND